MIRILVIPICLLFFLSCKEKNEASVTDVFLLDYLENTFKENFTAQTKAAIIIPNVGCSSCISQLESYLLSNGIFDNKFVLFVFTNIDDLKLLKLRYSKNSILQRNNVFVDKENKLFNKGFISFYPEFILFSNKKIIRRLFVDPKNNDVYPLIDNL